MGGRLRILTGNLANGAADPQAFADLVRSYRADVVAVQELVPEQAEALAEVMPHGVLEPARDFLGMGIALARPASLDRLPLGYRDAHIARLDPAGWPDLPRPIEIVNVHVISPVVRPVWTSLARRRVQLRALLRYLEESPERTCALIGDFNATPLWPVYRRIAARLEDVALAHARRRGGWPPRTWPSWPRGPRLLRIDHCFARGLSAEDLRVVPIPGSDHDAVIIDLTVS
jgi:endonuclease/exonuclease/phosphatase family metal-dependent hydrolase